MLNKNFFKKYSLFVLGFTLLTILWGAWVRISLSGDGCGQHWPLCNEAILPNSIEALVEWLHRLTSGIAFLFVLILFIFALIIYPKKHLVRKLSSLAFILMIVEALIGALLVLAKLVTIDQSTLRVFVLAFHLINSLILVGALSLCYSASLFDKIKLQKPHVYFLLAFPVLALTGNIASLAATLFPTSSLAQSLALDFAENAHITVQLRPFHPMLAIAFLVALVMVAYSSPAFKSLKWVSVFAFFAVAFGFATLLSLSPVWMKIAHLFIAYMLWIVLVNISFKKTNIL